MHGFFGGGKNDGPIFHKLGVNKISSKFEILNWNSLKLCYKSSTDLTMFQSNQFYFSIRKKNV